MCTPEDASAVDRALSFMTSHATNTATSTETESSSFGHFCSPQPAFPGVAAKATSSPRPCVGGTQSLKQSMSATESPIKFGGHADSGLGNESSSDYFNETYQATLNELLSSLGSENRANLTASTTTSSMLNSILCDSSITPPTEASKQQVDDNLSSMSKYVEELTGFTPALSAQSSSFVSSTGGRQAQLDTLQSFYRTGHPISKDVISKYLMQYSAAQRTKPAAVGNSDGSRFSPAASTSRQVFSFNGVGEASSQRPQRLSQTAADLSISDAALLNSLSSLSPTALASLLRSLDAGSLTSYASHGNQTSLAQSLEWFALLHRQQQQQQLQQQQQQREYLDAYFNGLYGKSGRNLSAAGMSSSKSQPGGLPASSFFAGNDIELAATSYRNSASAVGQRSEDVLRWSGELPLRNYKATPFSRKVFLGGMPWDATSDSIVQAFSSFGPLNVIWPQRDGHHGSSRHSGPKGYCYLIFDFEYSVGELLCHCYRDPESGGDYFRLQSPKMVTKDVQVIPWVIADSQFGKQATQRSESCQTVFIGALHGMITAETLATIMNDLFGCVTYAAIDTDKYKYPIGSGRVVFANARSYMKAVTANFVEVRTAKFSKTIQIDPYLEDATCSTCRVVAGLYFCRAFDCFQYYCPSCWKLRHNSAESQLNHKPLRRSWRQNGSDRG